MTVTVPNPESTTATTTDRAGDAARRAVAAERDQAQRREADPPVDRDDQGDDVIRPRRSPGRVAALSAVWLLVGLTAGAVVLYGLEPLFQERSQRLLLTDIKAQIAKASNEASGLPGVEAPTKAPAPGSPVAILEIGRLQLRQVVVEGVAPSQTQHGPGHVPGTAGLGQPGNSAVVGRRAMFGGAFGTLADATVGDEVLVTTTQGPSVYRITTVGEQEISTDPISSSGSLSVGSLGAPETGEGEVAGPAARPLDEMFGRTKDNRLTLVTSASSSPLNRSGALVVEAELQSEPFAPTPQGGRTDGQNGIAPDERAVPSVVLMVLAFVVAIVAARWFRRRVSIQSAYLVSVAPLVVLVIWAAETLTNLLPGWT